MNRPDVSKHSSRLSSQLYGIKRRETLRFLGGAAIASALGCVRRPSASAEANQSTQSPTQANSAAAATSRPACIVRPQQTEGPFFVDEGLNRSDIRTDPTDGLERPGVPLQLTFQISHARADACVPLAGAIVDIWHCDAAGVYSDVRDRSGNTLGQTFLRGFQTTNADGIAEFTTIYPGWYPGRTVHIHFKIRAGADAQRPYEFTSQLYFDDALTDQVQAMAPYRDRGQRTTRNRNDGIFRSGGEQLLLALAPTPEGYRSTFNIGLELDGPA